MNKIDKLFHNIDHPVLSIYLTAGYPELNSLRNLLPTLEKAGVDMVEVGMPFSDPLADGPIIQNSSLKALRNGMSIKVLFDQLSEIKTNIPIILMGYLNPVMQYGLERFLKECNECGISGTILPDFPVEEYLKSEELFKKNAVHNILLVTPLTSPERVQYLASVSKGFLYLVSSASTTGTKGFAEVDSSFFLNLQKLKLDIPTMIGFGIQTHEDFERAGRLSNGAIIGSKFIKLISQNLTNDGVSIESRIVEFVSELKAL